MCRHLAWLGSERSLHDIVINGPWSLYEQSHSPRHQRHGTMNADGWGIGWYAAPGGPAARHRTTASIWADGFVADVAPHVRTTCAVAAVRAASPGSPIVETGNAPFTDGTLLFSHNGTLAGHPATGPTFRRMLDDDIAADVMGATDSELLFTLVRQARRAGAPLADALAEVIAKVTPVTDGRMNLLASDGRSVAATTWGDTLSVAETATGVLVASEPTTDDDHWRAVPDGMVLVADDDGVHLTPL